MLTVKTIQKIERETTLVVPCFFREISIYPTYMGVLDETTLVKVYNSPSFTAVTSGHPEADSSSIDIADAYDKWDKITEGEFYEQYRNAMTTIELNAK